MNTFGVDDDKVSSHKIHYFNSGSLHHVPSVTVRCDHEDYNNYTHYVQCYVFMKTDTMRCPNTMITDCIILIIVVFFVST